VGCRANLYEFQKYNRESTDELYFTVPRLQLIAKQVRCICSARAAPHALHRSLSTLVSPHAGLSTHAWVGVERRQVLTSLEYLHSLKLIHCDLKPENILIKSYSRCEVKIIDLGSSCFQTDHLSSYVQSRSYRAPEVRVCLTCVRLLCVCVCV
jgi:serine/threonine protein kinase